MPTDSRPATFHGNLTKIGTSTFLDLTEVRGADAGPFLLPVHGVFRVTVAGDLLSAAPLDYGWFTRAMTQKTAGRPAAASTIAATWSSPRRPAELRRWLMQRPAAAFERADDVHEEAMKLRDCRLQIADWRRR